MTHPNFLEAIKRHQKDPTNNDWMFIDPNTGGAETVWADEMREPAIEKVKKLMKYLTRSKK